MAGPTRQTFSLGSINFGADPQTTQFEIPQDFQYGTETLGSVHRIPQTDGAPPKIIVQTLGVFPKPMSWKGRLLGMTAETRVLQMRALHQAQLIVPLVLGQKQWDVVVWALSFEQRSRFDIGYDIEVKPIVDRMGTMQSAASVAQGSVNALNQGYTNILAVQTQTDPRALNTVTGLQGVSTAIAAAQPETKQSTSSLLALAQTVTSALATASSLAATLTNSSASTDTALFLWAQKAIQALSAYNQSLSTVSGQDKSAAVTQNGGDLFTLAATALGDWTRWGDVMAGNPSIIDPFTTGSNTITIPRT